MRDAALPWVHRSEHLLRADHDRVVSRIFLPGQELGQPGESRSAVILGRVLDLDDAQVDQELETVRESFGHRHRDLDGTWDSHFMALEHRLVGAGRLPVNRRRLIGAYFTSEFAIEGAALFNPSMVAHPDQGGLLRADLTLDNGQVPTLIEFAAVVNQPEVSPSGGEIHLD